MKEVWLIKKLLKYKIKHKLIAKMFNVHKSLISYINTGKNWSHIKCVI